MKREYFTQEEKHLVLNWMQKYCCGRANAKFREQILPHLPFGDRQFRHIISELISEGHIYSSAAFGYFFMPLAFPTDLDIEAAKHAIRERKAKAISTLENCDKNLTRVEALRQGQQVFV